MAFSLMMGNFVVRSGSVNMVPYMVRRSWDSFPQVQHTCHMAPWMAWFEIFKAQGKYSPLCCVPGPLSLAQTFFIHCFLGICHLHILFQQLTILFKTFLVTSVDLPCQVRVYLHLWNTDLVFMYRTYSLIPLNNYNIFFSCDFSSYSFFLI